MDSTLCRTNVLAMRSCIFLQWLSSTFVTAIVECSANIFIGLTRVQRTSLLLGNKDAELAKTVLSTSVLDIFQYIRLIKVNRLQSAFKL